MPEYFRYFGIKKHNFFSHVTFKIFHSHIFVSINKDMRMRYFKCDTRIPFKNNI